MDEWDVEGRDGSCCRDVDGRDIKSSDISSCSVMRMGGLSIPSASARMSAGKGIGTVGKRKACISH